MDTTSLQDSFFLDRCAELANLAGPATSPNPKVGAVLVHNDIIIGEGYHRRAGQPHAEVNCLASVKEIDRPLIPKSTLYVSLEPCCFHGRTPACTDLIQQAGIQTVVIGQLDQTPRVSGQGRDILLQAGIQVRAYPNHAGCRRVAAERQVYVSRQRPYIILKYAQTADHLLAPEHNEDYWISSPLSRRLVHRWRAQTGAILVGAGTVLADDPQLTTRLYPGPTPLRIVLDPRGRCSGQELIFQNQADSPTLWFQPDSRVRSATSDGPETVPLPSSPQAWLPAILSELHRREIKQLTVEGGAYTLNLFLETGLWDEIRRFTNTKLWFGAGLSAPEVVVGNRPAEVLTLDQDRLEVFLNDPPV